MGLKCSPDFAQETMENIFCDVEDTEVYIDDIGAFSSSWEHHINFSTLSSQSFRITVSQLIRSSVTEP